MPIIDVKSKTVEAKIVYYGTAMGGKTTNLLVLHQLMESDRDQKLVSLNTSGDRTLFFDLLPFEFGKLFDWKLKLKLYTVPGQAEYNETRRVVMANSDALVFVADSSPDRGEENVKSANFFKLNLKQNNLDAETIPLVYQYNKRDVPNALPSSELEYLNFRKAPYFLATAVHGKGVLETFAAIVCELAMALKARLGTGLKSKVGPEEVQAAVHEQLRPLFAKAAHLSAQFSVAPESSHAHVVLRSEKEGRTAARPDQVLDTQDLLQQAIQNEMTFLNDMLERDPNTPPVTVAGLLGALKRAGEGAGIEQAAAPFLEVATQAAGVDRGSVMVLTPGDGPLAEIAKQLLAEDPLNRVTAFGGPTPARRLAAAGVAVFGAELVKSVPTAAREVVPVAAVPLSAMGRKVGLLTLYGDASTHPLTPAQKDALEAIATLLAVVVAFRGLERRLQSLAKEPAIPVARQA